MPKSLGLLVHLMEGRKETASLMFAEAWTTKVLIKQGSTTYHRSHLEVDCQVGITNFGPFGQR